MLAKPVELYNLLNIMRPDVFNSFEEYTQRYCAPKMGNYGMDYNGNSCCTELHHILSQNLMIRRLKKDVLSELPAKIRQKIEVNVDSKLQKEIKNILSEQRKSPEEQEDKLNFYGIKPVSFEDMRDEIQGEQKQDSLMTAYRLSG
jgi:SNF2 family DNA or RNA helicase